MERYNAKTKAWAAGFSACWRCGKRGIVFYTLTIHHFVRGTSRRKNDLRTTAVACPDCHDKEHRSDGIGLMGWLKLKHRFDEANYSLDEVARLRGRAIGSITQDEVDAVNL